MPPEIQNIEARIDQKKANVPKANNNDWVTEDVKARYEKGEYKIMLESITPRGGPTYGTTRVNVRAGGLEDLVDAYPDPKCKFGTNDKIVDATYIKCTKRPL